MRVRRVYVAGMLAAGFLLQTVPLLKSDPDNALRPDRLGSFAAGALLWMVAFLLLARWYGSTPRTSPRLYRILMALVAAFLVAQSYGPVMTFIRTLQFAPMEYQWRISDCALDGPACSTWGSLIVPATFLPTAGVLLAAATTGSSRLTCIGAASMGISGSVAVVMGALGGQTDIFTWVLLTVAVTLPGLAILWAGVGTGAEGHAVTAP